MEKEIYVVRVWKRDDSENRMPLENAVKTCERWLPPRPRRPTPVRVAEARKILLDGGVIETPHSLFCLAEENLR
jgi:hypothetical protein